VELTEIQRRLQRLSHGQLRAMQRETGVPYPTIRRIKDGVTLNPRLNTVAPIFVWLTRNDQPRRRTRGKG
jgi:predicted transcriptional regulator